MASSDDAPEQNGINGRATVSLVNAEVGRVSAKVDGLKDLLRAEFKDVGRRLDELAGLEPRVRQLENDAVRRVGPIVEEMRGFEQRVADLTGKVDEIAAKSATVEHVRIALDFERKQREEAQTQRFTRRQVITGLTFGAALFALNVFQAFHTL